MERKIKTFQELSDVLVKYPGWTNNHNPRTGVTRYYDSMGNLIACVHFNMKNLSVIEGVSV